MSIPASRRFRLALFASLYVVQGIGLAYFHNFQKPYLDEIGIAPDAIGALTFVIQLPFVLKIFVGMLSDRVNLFGMGHRKPYILIGLSVAALAFGLVTLVLPDTNFVLFAALMILGSFAMTLFDSTADGLAVDVTPHAEQGIVQGVMVGGRAGAFILLSLIFGRLVSSTGYRPVFLIAGLSMLVPLFWALRVREPAQRDAEARFQWAAFKDLGRPRFLFFALYAMVYAIGPFGADGLVTYSLSERFGASELIIGQYGALRGLGAVIGAVVGGVLIDRVGRKRSAYAAVVLVSVMVAAIGAASSAGGILWLGLPWGVVWAFQETLFLALAMAIADARIAASMFAIMMGIANLGSAVSDGLSTALSDDLGFAKVFWLLAVINLVTLPVLWGAFKKAPEIISRSDV